MLDYLEGQCLHYFLCQYNPRSRKRSSRDIVKELLLHDYSPERVDEFLDLRLPALQQALVNEFNTRYADGRPLRYQIVDAAAVGTVIQGYKVANSADEITFQDALHHLAPAEFEQLAAVVLKMLGCHQAFATPTSHDQGVDAFGHQQLTVDTPYGTTHQLTWIAQAKHYLSSHVSTGDIRELVGSKELLLARAFSTVDERYKELRLRQYAPTAIALLTAEEVPTTVRRLAENAGVYVFASSDLFHIVRPHLTNITVASVRRMLKRERKTIATLS